MAQGAMFLGGALVAVVLLGASASPSRALPTCSELPAAQRESARIAGRCEGQAPIVNLSQGKEARTPRTPVPDLRGQLFDQQDERLAGFFVAVDYRASAQQRDVVLDQVPRPPAALRPGSDLRLVLSDGALVRVPDVRGAFARALMMLHRAGLTWSADGPTDRVIGQLPPPGTTVRPGTEVVLQLAGTTPGPNPARAASARAAAAPGGPAAPNAPRAIAGIAAAAATASTASTAAAGPTPLRVTGPLALAPESTRPAITPAPPASSPSPSPSPSPAPSTAPAPTPGPAGATTAPPASSGPAQRSGPAVTATMPDLQGMIFDAARERLAGFSVQRTHRAGTEPGGTVIGQTPAAGASLAAGTTVRLVLSDGSLVRVPRVTSFTINEARQRLINGELRAVVTSVASDAPAGTVVSQQPGEGDIARRGGTVRLNVSTGPATPPTVAMPSVVGAPFDRARGQLNRFRVERTERGSSEPAGVILEQSPPPGERIEPGGTVSITVSSGGPPEAIELPEVVGQDVDAATAALSEFRLERETVASLEPAGRVVAQEPASGAGVAPGSTVRLRVSDGTLVRAPSFTNATLGEARASAAAKDLRIALTSGPDDADAVVVRQQPPAGSEVARGTEVQLAVEDRSPLAAMRAGVRDAWHRGTAAFGQVPAQLLAVALGVLLLLIAVALLVRSRRRRVKRPWYEVPPAPPAPPAQPATPQRAPSTSTPVRVAAKTAAMTGAPPPTGAVPKKAALTAPVLTDASAKPAPATAPPTRAAPASAAPTKEAPTKGAPARGAPTREAPTKAAPAKTAPTKAAPAKGAPPGRDPAWLARPAQPRVATPAPVPEPVAFGASARLEADDDATVAPAAAPRGPEIRITARLEPGEHSVREIADQAAADQLTEETK